ncbi:YicC/YloC family endoribonuclease [Planktotalea frisia]|uniref:YicC/YloC family endoribonuclease n=1 Tax=Planktotalea frisia TaxID=696762 RepID=UPI0023564521|nr:YicC/YloC family endoribonuclease [Planktotalea frisia]
MASTQRLTSMTGFAARAGQAEGFTWSWELRSVNGKGFDLRFRMPDWLGALEADLRKQVSAIVSRGSVSLNLRISRDAGDNALEINPEALTRVLDAIAQIEDQAGSVGVNLTPASASDVMNFRGVMDAPQNRDASERLLEALQADIASLLDSFDAMRAAEGASLHAVLSRQLDEVETLTKTAQALLAARADDMRSSFEAAIARVMDSRADMDEARIAQEIAVLAVKSDVTEEIDRLHAHVTAARDLLASGIPVGRKLDFLCQEFNREANTLCSKAQNAQLTEIGLALKVLIDQMREQVQNVE